MILFYLIKRAVKKQWSFLLSKKPPFTDDFLLLSCFHYESFVALNGRVQKDKKIAYYKLLTLATSARQWAPKARKNIYLSIDLFMSYVFPKQMEVFSQLRITDFGQLQTYVIVQTHFS